MRVAGPKGTGDDVKILCCGLLRVLPAQRAVNRGGDDVGEADRQFLHRDQSRLDGRQKGRKLVLLKELLCLVGDVLPHLVNLADQFGDSLTARKSPRPARAPMCKYLVEYGQFPSLEAE